MTNPRYATCNPFYFLVHYYRKPSDWERYDLQLNGYYIGSQQATRNIVLQLQAYWGSRGMLPR